MTRLEIDLFYSEEDEGLIANVPSLQFGSAFGETREDAMREIEVALDAWLRARSDRESEAP